MPLPDFLIVGAMKCGTTTLQAQLAAQPGVFMATPKEPNFFSDDDTYARGLDWYQGLFADAPSDALKGEASTHYTKLPTYPDCAARLTATLPDVRLVYLIRNPVARAISHFIHDWTMGLISEPIDRACARYPELTSYSCYARQIAPYVEAYGADRVLVVSLEEMEQHPQAVLERVCGFIGVPGPVVWREDLTRQNVSAERVRRFAFDWLLVRNPVAKALRRALLPKRWRVALKRRLQMRHRPDLPADMVSRLEHRFAQDHAELRHMFPGLRLSASYPFVPE